MSELPVRCGGIGGEHLGETSLADAVDVPGRAADLDTGGRIRAWAHALPTWALLANPEEFRLVYGDAVPGYQPLPRGAAPQAELRLCTGPLALAAAWPYAEHPHLDSDFQWADFDSGLLDQVRPAFPYPTSHPPSSP
ncbi:TetR-like C-terminal domain-containing protein [Streptomyces niveus]|uniref:TetR-like C-terminal domain-containing protein n=1 Tax=Streptomyces niveus TaxID=193462 RepID=UPI0033DE5A99